MAITKWYTSDNPKKDIKVKVVIPTDIVLEIPWYTGTAVDYLPDEYWVLVEAMTKELAEKFLIVSAGPNKLLSHYTDDVKEKKQDDGQQALGEMIAQFRNELQHPARIIPRGVDVLGNQFNAQANFAIQPRADAMMPPVPQPPEEEAF